MKYASKMALILLVAGGFSLSSCSSSAQIYSSDENYSNENYSASYDDFYTTLAPYGQWITYGSYGEVWVPSVGPDFRPYLTDGHWVYTDLGWTWASNYPWGWATFHYGRWFYDDQMGWAWIPGYQWSPAWVAWRSAPDCYGWAPLGPGMDVSINLQIPFNHWFFIPRDRMDDDDMYRYCVAPYRSEYYYRNSHMIESRYRYDHHEFFRGPSREDVGRSTHRSIQPVRIFQVDQPESAHLSTQGLAVYRPQLQRTYHNDAPRPVTDSHFFDRSHMDRGGNLGTSNRWASAPGNRMARTSAPSPEPAQPVPNRSYSNPSNRLYQAAPHSQANDWNRYQRTMPQPRSEESYRRPPEAPQNHQNVPAFDRYPGMAPQQQHVQEPNPSNQRMYESHPAPYHASEPQRALPSNQMIMDRSPQRDFKNQSSKNQDHSRTLFDH